MTLCAWFLAASCFLQVPPPNAAEEAAKALWREYHSILAVEAEELRKLSKDPAQPRFIDPNEQSRSVEPIRFHPLPEVVPATVEARENPYDWKALSPEAKEKVAKTAHDLFALADRSATEAKKYALADACLRRVLERDPNHEEARRLLGYVKYKDGWATPHAIELFAKGFVPHPKFGWVKADWVVHLDQGQLPGDKFDSRGNPREWLPAAAADALRDNWDKPWQITTSPHFLIRTNVPLAEAIAFSRHLEELHDFFFSQFADLIAPVQLPLASQFQHKGQKPSASAKKYEVWYFASKDEYVDYLQRHFGRDEKATLGFYMPPTEARNHKIPPRSYFYRDPGNPISVNQTLFHEASHQLLFETAGRTLVEANVGNFWVWEGLGTYFETVVPQPDGSLLVGGRVGPRFNQARLTASSKGYVPVANLVAMNKDEFLDLRDGAVYRHYNESMALALFLLQGEGGRYREGFIDYASRAYRGKVKPHSLADGLGVDFQTLDAEFLSFLRGMDKPR